MAVTIDGKKDFSAAVPKAQSLLNLQLLLLLQLWEINYVDLYVINALLCSPVT